MSILTDEDIDKLLSNDPVFRNELQESLLIAEEKHTASSSRTDKSELLTKWIGLLNKKN